MTVMIVLCTAFAGCTEDSLSSGSVPGPAASKIINSRANAVPGGLIIKLDSLLRKILSHDKEMLFIHSGLPPHPKSFRFIK